MSPVVSSVPPFDCYRQFFHQEYSVRDANDADQRISIRASFHGKELSLEYSVYDDVNGAVSRVVRETVTHPASMHITGVVHLGDGRLAVSGMSPTTKVAKIEVWAFSRPAVYRVPASDGGTQYIFRPSSLYKVDVGFAPAAESGFGLIKSMWPNRALGDGHLLVLSCHDRDLYSVDLGTKTATRFLSSTEQVGSSLAAPELANTWVGSYGPRRHTTLGDAYVLSMEADVAPPDNVPVMLYLWDHNVDGAIDEVVFLSNGQSAAQGFTDPDVWDSSWPN